MGIRVRISVAGKMLGRAQHAAVQQAAYHPVGVTGDLLRRVAVASRTDDRIFRVGIDVHTGGKVEIDAQRAQLPPRQKPGAVGIFRVSRGGDGHSARHIYRVPGQTRHQAALLVRCDKGAMARFPPHQRLDLPAQLFELCTIRNVLPEQDHIGYFVLPHHPAEILRKLCSRKACHQSLPDLFP